jgi:membrane-associated phospholipid phosphatase
MRKNWKTRFGRGIFGTGWARAAVSLALALGVFFMSRIYDLLNHGPAVLDLRSPLDTALPLVPIFVIPYMSLQPYIYASLLLFLFFRTKVFQSAAAAFILTWAVSYAFYALLQTEVIRPAIAGADPLSRMIRVVYAGDSPYNDFPSLHSSLSVILAIHWLRVRRWAGTAAWAWTALILASTLFIKQHYAADVVGGALLAVGTSLLSRKLFSRGA